jgi:cytoskeleton protein RodZ
MNVGTQLRQARESHGLSLAQLAATTRVNARVLDGLERNDLTAVPPRPYSRGFIASYAREVGLNPEETVRNYFAQFEQTTTPPAGTPRPVRSPVRLDDDRWRPLPVVAAVLLIAVLGALAAGRLRNPSSPPVEGAVGTTGVVAPGDPTLGAAKAAELELKPVGLSSPAGAAPSTGSGSATALSANRNGLVVALEAESPSWVTATADGDRKIYQVVQTGTKHTLRASREIVVRVGDAGALRWSVNGRAAVPMGSRGEVRTIRLTPDGAR